MKVKCIIISEKIVDNILKVGEWYDVIGTEYYEYNSPYTEENGSKFEHGKPYKYLIKINKREYVFHASQFQTIDENRDTILENILNNE